MILYYNNLNDVNSFNMYLGVFCIENVGKFCYSLTI